MAQRVIVIPARLHSRRLPRKPLIEVGGWPLIRWVWSRATQVACDRVLVASPDEEVLDAVERFGGEAVLTHADHESGTHRVSQAAWDVWDRNEHSVIVNLQADEPLLAPGDLERLFLRMEQWPFQGAWTMVAKLGTSREDLELLADPNVVKVAYSGNRCLWFSRAPLAGAYAHVGVYAFRAPVLFEIGALSTSALSRAENLEQLTWIEHVYDVRAIELHKMPLAINTPLDVERFRWQVERA